MEANKTIPDTMAFIEEQLKALKGNLFNGTFIVDLGYKDGGICTTGTSVVQQRKGGLPNVVLSTNRRVAFKKN